MSTSTAGHRQAQLHQRQQRVAAGEQLGVVAVLGERGERLVHGAGPDVLERRGDHACTSCAATWPAAGPACAAARTARTMLW